MNLFKLFAVLTLSSESYKKGIADAKKENQGFEQSTGKMSKVAVAGWLAVAAVIVKVVQSIGKLIVETAAYGAEVTRLSYKLGLSKEAVQEWDYVAQMNGTTVESLSTVMRNLSNMAVENNSDLVGLIGTIKNANGEYKTQEQLLRETLAALNAIPNQQERNAAANKVLGRSYQELGGIINLTTAEIDAQIRTAHELGIVLGDDVIAGADKMDNELKSLSMMRRAAFAQLVFGDPEEGERILDEYVKKIHEIAPKMIDAGLKIAGALVGELALYFAPGIAGYIAGMAIGGPPGAIVGFLLGMGLKAGVSALADWAAGGKSESSSISDRVSGLSSSNITSAYASSTDVTQTMDVKITAEGNTPISEQTAVDVGKAVLDMLNQVQVTI